MGLLDRLGIGLALGKEHPGLLVAQTAGRKQGGVAEGRHADRAIPGGLALARRGVHPLQASIEVALEDLEHPQAGIDGQDRLPVTALSGLGTARLRSSVAPRRDPWN